MASSRLMLCLWAPVLVASIVLQHLSQLEGFEYIDWSDTLAARSNATDTNNDTAPNPKPSHRTREPRDVDFYKAYNEHRPMYFWVDANSEIGDDPLPIDTFVVDFHLHEFTARGSQFPSQSLIILKDKEGKAHTCGCILLHEDLVMTTRRCIESKVAAKVVNRRTLHNNTLSEMPTTYAFVKGFCVLDKNSKEYDKDVAIGFLASKLEYGDLLKPAAVLPDQTNPIRQMVGLVREGHYNGYNILKPGCSKPPGGDRTCYTSTSRGSRHICEGVDQGMGVYHLTAVEQQGKYKRPSIYLAGIMDQAEHGPETCRKDTPEGQWIYYVDFKKIPKLKEMITRCYM